MNTIADWLRANDDLDRLDRELLLCAAAGIDRARLLAFPETDLPPSCLPRLDDWAARRRAGVPVAYLLGSQGFQDFELTVTQDVLIPRPETELLVEIALGCIRPGHRVLDLGTGSGAIAIAIARASEAVVTAVDVSENALAIAATNGQRLGATVRWVHGDWCSELAGSFDLIVSNPPYIAAADPHLSALRHEPALALVSGHDGLDAIRTISEQAPRHLTASGWLLLEHGFDQGQAVRDLLAQRGFREVRTERDLAGHERVTCGRWRALTAGVSM